MHSSGIIDLKYIQQTGEDMELLDRRNCKLSRSKQVIGTYR